MEVKDNLIELEVVYSKLNKALDENINRLNIGAVAVDNYNKKISVVPSEFQKSLVDIKTKTDAVTQSTKQLEQAEKKIQQERVKELQLQKQREQAIDKYNASLEKQALAEQNARKKQVQGILDQSKALNSLEAQKQKELASLEKENSKLAAASNAYNKLQAELSKLQFAYQNLAVRKEQGATLTKAEAQQYDYLKNRIQQHDKTLKAVDATMGKHQRNVGNYASGFNPLNNSINQLAREMPAFANSVQTGFMAISNNLPIFFDAITHTKNEIKAMKKDGQEVPSLFQKLTSSLLSWGTALSVGVTLLTVYGKEMVKFVSSLWGASDAIDELNKNQKEFNESRIQGSKESIKDRTELEKYVKIMRNSNLSTEERAIALKKIRDQFPFYFKGLKDEVLLNGDITKNLQTLNLALERRGVLNKAQEANIKNKERLIDLREELRLNEKAIVNAKKELDNKNAIVESQGVNRANRIAQLKAEDYYNSVLEKQTRIKNDILSFEKAIAINKKIENDLAGQTIALEYTQEEQGNKRLARKKKEKELDEQLLFGTEAWLDAQISALKETRRKTAKSSDAYREISGAIAYYQKWLETLTGAQKKSNEETEKTLAYGTIPYYESLQQEIKGLQNLVTDTSGEEYARLQKQIDFYQVLIDAIRGVKTETKELEKANTDYFDSFIDSFTSDSGFSKTFELIKDNFKLLKEGGATAALAISEAFQEAFNTISQASQANFDAEYNRLSMQKEVALQFAGESSTAKEEIERQYEEKRKAIARRQAESEKRLAIFNIGINTAQAIIATLAKTPPPVGLPLAIAVGAIGAAQIAMVSAQEIPQFWRGTENAPEGWALTQEKGAEVITDKYGKVKSYGSDKGAQMTYLNRGDKVYNAQKSEAYINKELAKKGIMPMRQSIINNNENNSLSKDDFNNGISKLAKTFKNGQPTNNTQVFLNNKQINTDYYKGKKV